MPTLDEWIEKYNKKAPGPFKRDERYELFFHPDYGFCEVGQTENMIVINQLSGDGRYWKRKIDELGKSIGIAMGGTWCIRTAILAYIRLFGFRIYKTEELSDGLKRFYGVDKEGRKGIASPAFKYLGGEQAYFITWETGGVA